MRILWLEDEGDTLKKLPYRKRLEKADHYVRIGKDVTEVESLLTDKAGWQILLVDLLVPPSGKEEVRRYGRRGPLLGLYFLQSQMDRLANLNCCPIIFTSDRRDEPQELARDLGLGGVPYISTYGIDDDPGQFVVRIDKEYRSWTERK